MNQAVTRTVAAAALVLSALAGGSAVGAQVSPPGGDRQPTNVPSRQAAGPALAPAVVAANGDFTAQADGTPPVTRPLLGGWCEYRLTGSLHFTGTLSGVATGTTTAMIFEPCDEVLRQPPGTFADAFRFEGTFAGTVAGVPAAGALTYSGTTAPGGDIDAVIVLRGTSAAVLRADARVLVGGDYTGVATP